MADIKVCDACMLDSKLNPKVVWTYGFRGAPRLHFCLEHKGSKVASIEDQRQMIKEVEPILKNGEVQVSRMRSYAKTRRRGLSIRVVPNEYGTCPRCGAYWGHPNKELDFPNRQKVDDWWRCYNPKCPVAYFHPETQKVELEGVGES